MESLIKCIPGVGRPREILLIDDQASMLTGLTFALKRFGEISLAESVAQAIGVLESRRFDLVVVDYQLHDGTGLDVLRFLKGSKCQRLMVSGHLEKEIIMEAFRLGASGFVEKPFTVDGLHAEVIKALEGECHGLCRRIVRAYQVLKAD